ncbi:MULTISPECIES: aspartate aminotransferase family protein [unclassified Agarivorans]|uniref:aspartate aminotransferase family protein n=1 Tax=unclassified Agarivorans TaxID=2636026 RepID=UPI0026E1AF6E|nr:MULTISPECIES: aspartate aminotransferase family protein [unclassified Agarivorans]MDO6685385.1 aspartate aminotransferase family protein [Agarivorans sp. 3_MG-2023]MDO6715771.1 aspartate aminotransferase family protein [Agarivorans sp. 2_MG-2023]
MSTATLTIQQQDSAHCLHPFTNFKELNEKGARVIERGEGVFVYDNEGNKLLDAMAGLWCVNLGYGRQELVDAAAKQMQQLPYYNLFFQTTHSPAVELSKLLAELTPEGLNRAFFTGSGSECNDTVVRMVRHYWASKGQPNKLEIISRNNAYHGSTMAGASLGGMGFMHAQGGLPLPNICHIDQPYWFEEGQGQDPQAFGVERARQLEQKILELGEDKVAAFIAEPIQGAGGVIIPPDSYWPEIQRICDKYQILLIVDEVICGFGRTGEWFASQTYNIKPDLLCLAKGITSGYLPLGAVMVSDKVAQGLIDADTEFAHGFTYSGHPAACAVAIENIRIMQQENIVNTVRNDTAPYLAQRWQELGEHPLVGESRSKGMVAAIELVANKNTNQRYGKDVGAGGVCRDICINNGLIMRACGDTMIISPPLVITKQQIDQLITLAKQSLDDTLQALS